MKKTYFLEGLDCAHCASLIEGDVAKLDGVTNSTVSLITQKLCVETDFEQDKKFLKIIKKVVKKYEPDVEVSEA